MWFDANNPDRLTDRARSVLVEAERLAVHRNAPDIGPADLLLALARSIGVHKHMLERLGIALEKLESDLAGRLAPQQLRPIQPGPRLPAVSVVAAAKREASELGHKYIGTEHLLIGLMRDYDSDTATILRRHSSAASIDQAQEVLRAILDEAAKTHVFAVQKDFAVGRLSREGVEFNFGIVSLTQDDAAVRIEVAMPGETKQILTFTIDAKNFDDLTNMVDAIRAIRERRK